MKSSWDFERKLMGISPCDLDANQRARLENYQRWLAGTHEKVHGREHIETALVLDRLADTVAVRDPVSALAIMLESLEIKEKTVGTTHPDTLLHLEKAAKMDQYLRGRHVTFQGDETFLWRLVRFKERIFGPFHKETLLALNGLMDKVAQGKEELEELFWRYIDLAEEELPPGDSRLPEVVFLLGRFMENQERFAEAALQFDRCAQLHRKSGRVVPAAMSDVRLYKALVRSGQRVDKARLENAIRILESARAERSLDDGCKQQSTE